MIATKKRRKLGKPLKYAGGKGHCSDQLLLCRPPYFDMYREPFCGGCLIWNYKALPLTMPRWINDLDQPLMNFYTCLRDDNTFIPKFLELKNQIVGNADRVLTAFENAKLDYKTNPVSYMLLRRFALNQVVRESRPNIASLSYEYLAEPAALRPFTRSRLTAWKKLLQDVKITCADYMSVLDAPVKRGKVCWSFIDPPYWSNIFKKRGEEIYEHVLNGDDHERLRDKLAGLNPKRHKFLMTLCDSEMSHALYGVDGRFYIYDRRVIYGMMGSNVEKKVVKEIVVTNYAI